MECLRLHKQRVRLHSESYYAVREEILGLMLFYVSASEVCRRTEHMLHFGNYVKVLTQM